MKYVNIAILKYKINTLLQVMKLNKKFLFLFCTFFFFSESIGILYAKEKCSDSILTELYLTKQNNLFLSIKNCDSTAIKVFPKFYIDLDRSVSKILLWNRVLGENSWTFGALTGYLEEPYRRDFYELKDSIQPNKRVWLPLLNISQGKTQEVYAEVHLVYYVNGSSGYKIISNTPTLIINNSEQKNVQLIAERVDRVGDFNPESLSRKYGYIEFDRGEGKYAFDNGKLDWYKKSVKVDRFYKSVAKGYIAPWKLVPVGENDVVTAKYKGSKNIDLKKVRFASEPNTAALPAKFNEAEQTWTISLRSVSSGASYDVFAVYEGVAIGKLRVVSYAKQQHKVTLVPINEVRLDKTTIEQGLNAIYNPVGVQFTVNVDESMRGNYSWEVDSEKDGLLSTVGKSFWGYDKELKESTEMLNLQKTYQQEAGTLDGVYLFVLNGAKGLEGQNKYLLGEMPRKSRFGYIFTANSYNTTSLVRTIAHEVGHGIFTLQHTFDNEYGKGTLKETENLLDYKEGTDLVAFQWNVMANPAVFTGADKAKDVKIERYKSRMVCIPQYVSDAIMNSQKSLLSAKGDKIELPKGSIIKALFYSDTSIHPAPSGSIAEFEINGHSYETWYRTHTKYFDSYGYTAKGDTVPWKIMSSNKEPVQIIINPANYTINVNGKGSIGVYYKNATGINGNDIVDNVSSSNVDGEFNNTNPLSGGTGTLNVTGEDSTRTAVIKYDPQKRPVGGVQLKRDENGVLRAYVDGQLQIPETVNPEQTPSNNYMFSNIGVYIDTLGRTRAITGNAYRPTGKIDLVIGVEAAQKTGAKTIKIPWETVAPYLGTQTVGTKVNIYSAGLHWMASYEDGSASPTGEKYVLMRKIDYRKYAKDKDLYNFLDGLEQRYGVEGIGTREKALFNALNGIGDNESIVWVQAVDEMMGRQYANVQQRIYATGTELDKQFGQLQKEWRTTSKQSNKITSFGTRGEYKTETAGIKDYTNNAYGVAYLHENETVKLGNNSGWYAGAVHNTFKFKDIGKSKEKTLMFKAGVFKSKAFDHNGSLKWTVSGEGYAARSEMDRRYWVAEDIFKAESNYNSYGVAIKNEIGKDFRIGERFSIIPYGSLKLEYGRFNTIKEKKGEMRLEVKANDYYSVNPEVGVEFKYKQPMAVKTTFVTTLGLSYNNELGKVSDGKNKLRVGYTEADWYNIRGEKDDRKGNFKADLNIGVENQRFGVTLNGGYDTKGKNVRGGLGFRIIY